MGLRRVLLKTHLRPFCTSPSPIQLCTSFLRAKYNINSSWTSSFLRFFSAGQTKLNSSEHLAERQNEATRLAKLIAHRKRSNELQRYKLATDPETLRRFRHSQRLYERMKRQKVDRTREYEMSAKQERQRLQSDPAYLLNRRIPLILRRHQWLRESVLWKTHLPIIYDEKVHHECSKCLVTRWGGAKLWWQKKRTETDEPESYECHRCYFTGFDKLPKGYEDIPKAACSALKARKIELDGLDSISEHRKHATKTTTAKKT
jgi:DNA-directed RNA polymerase subunit M/transcription elongation factor TFIIS